MRRLVPALAFATGACVGGVAAIVWVVVEDTRRNRGRRYG